MHRLLALTETVSASDELRLLSFSKNFLELWANWEEVRHHIPRTFSFELCSDGRVDGGDIEISRHRLKGLLADYRKFHLKKEPINFFAICQIVTKSCRDRELLELIDLHRRAWRLSVVI